MKYSEILNAHRNENNGNISTATSQVVGIVTDNPVGTGNNLLLTAVVNTIINVPTGTSLLVNLATLKVMVEMEKMSIRAKFRVISDPDGQLD